MSDLPAICVSLELPGSCVEGLRRLVAEGAAGSDKLPPYRKAQDLSGERQAIQRTKGVWGGDIYCWNR